METVRKTGAYKRNAPHRLGTTVWRLAREMVAFVIRWTGLAWFLREIVARNRVTILVYHDPSREIFARHAAALNRWHHFISMDAFFEARETGAWEDLPPRPLIVTFDDGHRRNVDLLPVFSERSIRPVVYLCSDIVNTHRAFWWTTGVSDAEAVKKIDHDAFLGRLQEETGYSLRREYFERQALDESELRALAGQVSFGSHGKTHLILTRCPPEICESEIAGSREQLQTLLNTEVCDFAYPNGEVTDRERGCVEQAGYRSARTLRPGWNGPNADQYTLRAMCVDDDASLNVLCAQSCAVLPALGAFRRWARGRTRS